MTPISKDEISAMSTRDFLGWLAGAIDDDEIFCAIADRLRRADEVDEPNSRPSTKSPETDNQTTLTDKPSIQWKQ